MKTMNAVNAVQLFIVVWTFTAVCQADGKRINFPLERVCANNEEGLNLRS